MQALEGSAVRVLARDEHTEALRAGGDARHVRSLGVTGLERQISDSPEFAADKGGSDVGDLCH